MSKKKLDSSPEAAAPSLGDVAARAGEALHARMEQSPYQTLGIAIGLGVVVGGGMWRLLARPLFGAGARTFVAAVVPALLGQSNHQEE